MDNEWHNFFWGIIFKRLKLPLKLPYVSCTSQFLDCLKSYLKIFIFFLSDLAYDITETAKLNLYYFWTALTFMLLLSFAFFQLNAVQVENMFLFNCSFVWDSNTLFQAVDTVVAGILHDVVDDTSQSLQDIKTEFGDDVVKLVASVSRLSYINQVP